jgi:formylglycine-generating enzyme required for sulfatase activity/uncharacterized caspase-like protein
MVRIVFVLLLCLLSLPLPALAEKRAAFVVGIDKYDNLSKDAQLDKARNDARAVARLLKDLGFDVIAKEDIARSAFNSHWQDFLNKLGPGDTAAFYFAGHGVEFGGRTYLLPRDVPSLKPGRDELLRREALSLQEFLADLKEKGTRLNLVILDACRENPFEQVAGRSVGGRRGLPITEPPEGTFIMYSAGAAETALDVLDENDRDPNSVYTRHLLPLLKTPGLSLTEVAEQVRVSVRQMAATVQHRQTPAYYNQVIGRVCLAGGDCGLRIVAGPASPTSSEAGEAWAVTRGTTSIPALEAFIRRFGDTYYGDLAKVRLAEMKENEVAAKRKVEEDAKAEAERQRVTLRPGREFRDCPDVCPAMVVLPAGEFMMGSPSGEAGRSSDEGPQRKVTMPRPFAVGKYEVTFAEWEACVAGGGCTGNRTPSDQGWGKGRRPVINVSWRDVKEYVAWLSRKTRKSYRLLSEAEWEYAARAGTTTRYAFGDTINKSQAQFYDARETEEVGSFPANRFGLHDMHGNVWEWVEDAWRPGYQEAPLDGSVWEGGDMSLRVLRGGSWGNHNPDDLRSALRFRVRPVNRVYLFGFRVARTL